MFNHNRIIASLLLLLSCSANAENDAKLEHFLSLSLEELMEQEITISTDTKQTITKAPAAVSSISSDDIKATGSTNIAEILETIPGVHIKYHHFGFRPLIEFRGANATQTLLMVDGIPMRDLNWSYGIFWKGLPTNSIKRIEVMRGPGSALFGADASAGVINVITKTAGKIDSSEIGLRRGSFNTNSGWMQYGESWNNFDIGLTMDFHDTNGHDPFIESDRQTIDDQRDATNASYAPDNAHYGWRNQDIRFSIAKQKWRLNLDYTHHSNLQTGFTGGGKLDPVTKANDKRFNAGLLYNNENFYPNLGIDAELQYQDLKYSSGDGFLEDPPGSDGVNINGNINQMRSAERRLAFELSGLYSGIEEQTIRLGTGYTWQDLYRVEQFRNTGPGPDGIDIPTDSDLVDVSDSPHAFAPEKARKIHYFFIQDAWAITTDWELTAGLRYDHYSDFGTTVNPRLALVWSRTDRITTKLLYGRAFRPPSFRELYSITTDAQPNANLQPERSETLELAFTYIISRDLNLGLSIYQYQQSDSIRSIEIANKTKKQFMNTGETTINGIELEAKWQPTANLRVSANYTIRDQDKDVPYPVYNQDAYLRTDWGFHPDWNWNIQSNWVGEYLRKSNGDCPTCDNSVITDTTLRYTGIQNWEFAASVRNLFNEEACEQTNDLPLPERSVFAEIRYKFRK
jgi:outer membrane receptor protein involved in Fe transport